MNQTAENLGRPDSIGFGRSHILAVGESCSNAPAEVQNGNNLEIAENVATAYMYPLGLGSIEPRLMMDKALP